MGTLDFTFRDIHWISGSVLPKTVQKEKSLTLGELCFVPLQVQRLFEGGPSTPGSSLSQVWSVMTVAQSSSTFP